MKRKINNDKYDKNEGGVRKDHTKYKYESQYQIQIRAK